MPGIFYHPVTRSEFLWRSALAAGATCLTAWDPRHAAAADPSDAARIALLSDTHIPFDPTDGHRGFLPTDNLRQIVPQVQAAQPQAVIINGDAARLVGQTNDYRTLQGLLQPLAAQAPILIGLGNHDDRRHFWEVFPPDTTQRQPVTEKHVAVMEFATVRLIVLDSLLYVNQVAGLLGKDQRTWLSEYLPTVDARPTVLFVHHTLGDNDGDLLDVDRLFQIMTRHRQVKALFYGHSHRYAVERRDGIQCVNLPAVGYNFSDDQPIGWIDARFTSQGVDLTLHALAGNRKGDQQTTSLTWT